MREPFDIEMNGVDYAVFPEEEGRYTIFKDGLEYLKIQEDELYWLRLHPETELPMFDENEEVNQLGQEIRKVIGSSDAQNKPGPA